MNRFPTTRYIMPVTVFLAALICSSCSAPQNAARPGWVDNPPPHDSRNLYFVGGSGWRGSKSDAKAAARAAAIGEVPRYIASQVQSLVADVQVNENGADTNRVEIAVTVVGTAVTLREVSVLEYSCDRSAAGYDCSALVAYPRAEYDRAVAEIDAAEEAWRVRQDQSGRAALSSYFDAVNLEDSGKPCHSVDRLKESQAALKSISGVLALDNPSLPNTDILGREVAAGLARVAPACDKTRNWIAVRVVVSFDGADSDRHAQALFTSLTTVAAKYGFETNREPITAGDAGLCLSGDRDAAIGAAGASRYLLVVRERSEFSSERFGLEFYSRAAADWALVDPSSGAVLASGSPSGVSGAGISRSGACDAAINSLWSAHLAPAVNNALAAIKR